MQEYFDMYDAKRVSLGHTHPRGVPIREGEYHIVVQVCVIDARGRLLLTKRHPDKPLPNMWETTAGSVLAGEDVLTGALRELREETGLQVEGEMLIPLFTRMRDDNFLDSFLVRLDADGDSLTLTMQEGETLDFIWADVDTQQQMEKDGLLVPITVEARTYLNKL